MADHWQGMYEDKYAINRIKKSVSLLDLKSNMTILDVGCYKMEPRKYIPCDVKYAGIDVSDFTPEVTVKDIDGGFSWFEKVDRVLCLEVLEHMKFPQGTLKSIKKVLKDDGIAIISLPNEATLFHRVRCLTGTVDQECFQECGKHLHLPSLAQCRSFLRDYLTIEHEAYYSSDGNNSRQSWMQSLLRLIPDWLKQALADRLPSLFARGFIFVCKKSA